MKKILTILVVLVILLFLNGCVDFPEKESMGEGTKEKSESAGTVTPCMDECTTNGCEGTKFIECVVQQNGCKAEINRGETIGECNVECITSSDCSENKECKDYKCITKETPLGHSRSKPAPKNTELTTEVEDWMDNFKAKITLTDFKRGNVAWGMIKEANMFNDEPSEGEEYILAKIKFELLETKDGESYDIETYKFEAVSGSGKVHDSPYIVEPEPRLEKELYPGASHEGWLAVRVDKDDAKPLLSFNRGNKGELWFRLY